MATEAHAAHGGNDGHEAHESHLKAYVLIGVILTVITAAEVAIFYIPALESVLIPSLLVMSAGKFLLVVYYYMHLKFDHPVFSRVFFGPMLLAVLFVAVGLIMLFKFVPRFDAY